MSMADFMTPHVIEADAFAFRTRPGRYVFPFHPFSGGKGAGEQGYMRWVVELVADGVTKTFQKVILSAQDTFDPRYRGIALHVPITFTSLSRNAETRARSAGGRLSLLDAIGAIGFCSTHGLPALRCIPYAEDRFLILDFKQERGEADLFFSPVDEDV